MKPAGIAALAVIVTATALPAQAAWEHGAHPDDGMYFSWATDTTSSYRLDLICDMEFGLSISLTSVSALDMPAEAALVFTLDGTEYPAVTFTLSRLDPASIEADDEDNDAVPELVGAMLRSVLSIDARVFDTDLQFTAEGAVDAIYETYASCYQP